MLKDPFELSGTQTISVFGYQMPFGHTTRSAVFLVFWFGVLGYFSDGHPGMLALALFMGPYLLPLGLGVPGLGHLLYLIAIYFTLRAQRPSRFILGMLSLAALVGFNFYACSRLEGH